MISVAEILRLLPDAKKNNARIWAGYSMLWLPLVGSTSTIKQSITTQDDSDFVAMRMKAYATTNASPPVEVPAPQAIFTLTIGSNQIFPDANPVHVGMIVDNATKEGGHDFEYPVYVPASTTLQAFATNNTSTDMMLRITVFGMRIFNMTRGSKSL